MNIAEVEKIGAEVLELLSKYHNPASKELLIDAILLAYLSGRYSNVSRGHKVYVYGSTHPRRIDFRIGGTNAVVLELAVRAHATAGSLYGGQNLTELKKLCRVRQPEARLRVLLLLDLADHSFPRDTLKKRL